MKNVYLALALLGAVGPYYYFLQFDEGGFMGFMSQLYGNPASAGFATDLMISSLVFWFWTFGETRRRGMKGWIGYVIANAVIGLSFALPFFFFMRMRAMERAEA